MPADAEVYAWHPQPWTLEEVLAMPEDSGARVELVDGTLVMSPAPTPNHQRILQRLQVALLPAVPAGLELLPGVNVVLGDRHLTIPDLSVTTRPGATGLYFTGEQIALAVEIASPSTRTHDRVTKRALYAEAGVRHLLLVDPTDPPTGIGYELRAGGYVEVTRSVNGVIRLERPFPVQLDLTGCPPRS